jgi:cullin 3
MCCVPQPVQATIEHFEDFYLKKHTGRKLSWQTSTGTAEIRATFGSPPKQRQYDLIVSTYQMCILMLFNNKETITFGEIMEATSIPDLQLRRHLISLSTPKHRILRKGSKGKGFSGDDETFTFNDEYKSNMRRVKIPLVNLKEALNTVAKTSGANAPGVTGNNANIDSTNGELPLLVEEERRHLVEAATVRIMKARKQLQHNDLIAEVTKQLSSRFIPSPQFIKKRIEGLIEREYIERSEDDHRMYTYVA